MRILHVIHKMDPEMGGVCQAVRTIVFSLNKSGISNEVVSLDRSDAPFLSKETIVIHALGTGKGLWEYTPMLLPWLKVNFHRFDRVVVHGLWKYHTYAVWKAIKFFKAQGRLKGNVMEVPKYFIMPHGMLDPYFQRARGRKLKAIRNWVYWKLLEGAVVNDADGALFTCEEEKRLAREPFRPYRPKKEIVIGLGVASPPSCNLEKKQAFLKKCPEVENSRYILFLSRIHEKKGVDLLIQAYQKLYNNVQVAEKLPKLVIAGPGIETVYGRKIQNLVSRTPALANLIYFPGMLNGDSKWGAFYECDAFILPSHQENFGIAVVEALACGKAVLISNQVNIWREIDAAGGGIIKDNTIEGTLAMLKCWEGLNLEDRVTLGIKAKQTFEKYFTIETITENLKQALS